MTLKNASKWMTVFSLSFILAACDTGEDLGSEDSGENNNGIDTEDFDTSQAIHVVSREDGSGTRTAFVEIAGLEDENGNDQTYAGATIQNSTNAVMQSVAGDSTAIGYVSLGSLDDSVRGIAVDGSEPSEESISSGEYPISRNFNLAYGDELSEAAADFWEFVLSAEGQFVVEELGFLAIDADAPEYEAPESLEGQISIVGSTSVGPVIEAISEAYREIHPDVSFDLTEAGSGAGVTAAIDGTADIGMASRELDESEIDELTDYAAIAIDGIAVIVNSENPIEGVSLDQIQGVFLGELTSWDEIF